MTHRSSAILAVFMLLAHQSFAAPQLFNNRFSGFGSFGNNGGGVRFGTPPQQQQRFAQTSLQANGVGSGFGGGLFTGGGNQQQQGLPSATFPGQGNGGGNSFGNGQQQQQLGNTAGVVANNPGDRFLQQFGQQQQPAVGNNGQFGAINSNPVGSFPQPQAGNQFGQSQQQGASGQLLARNNGGFNGNNNAGNNNFQPSNGMGVASSSGGKINMNDGMTGNSGFDDDAKLLDTFHTSFMPKQPQQEPQQVVPESSADGGGDAQFDPNEQQQQIQQQQQQQQFSPAGFRQQQLQARLQGGFAPQPQAQGGLQLDGRLLFSNHVANRRPGDVSTVLATQSQQQSPQGGAGGLSGDDLAALQKAGIDPTQVSLGDGPPQPNRFRRPPPTLTSGMGGIAISDPNDPSPTIIPAMGRRPPMRRRPRPPPPPQPMDDGSSDGGADEGTSGGGGGGEDSAPPPSARPPQGGKQLDPAQFGLPPGTIILGEQTFDSGESEVDDKGKSASDHFVPPPLKKGAIKTGRIEGDDPDAMKKLIAQLKALTSQGGDAAPTDEKGTARDVTDDTAPATPSVVPTVQDSLQRALAKQPAASPTTKPTSVTL